MVMARIRTRVAPEFQSPIPHTSLIEFDSAMGRLDGVEPLVSFDADFTPPPSGRTHWWPLTTFVGTGILLAVASLFTGVWSPTHYVIPILGMLTIIAVVVGARFYMPKPVWPWYCAASALGLFTSGGILQYTFHTLGNDTASRSLVPDMIIIPGYVLVGVALCGLMYSRRSRGKGGVDVLLDASIAALAVFCCAWIFILEPVLNDKQSPTSVKVVFILYPVASIFMAAIVLQLAFTRGVKWNAASRLLVGAMTAMLIGDTLYMLVDADIIHEPFPITTLPYVIAFVLFGTLSLHPSMVRLHSLGGRVHETRSRSRLIVVSISLVVPVGLYVSTNQLAWRDRLVLGLTILALTAAVVVRMFRALYAASSSEARLAHQATHDLLTGLPNRALMQRYITEALVTAATSHTEVAVLFVDLDRFKQVNDTWGHSFGDELLISVSERLRKSIRSGDLVARIGGDEFVVVLQEISEFEQAKELSERIRQDLLQPFHIRRHEISVSASVGLTIAADAHKGQQSDLMLRNADNAMYEAKAKGGNAISYFDARMSRGLTEQREMERDLRRAVSNGEFDIVFQPIIHLQSGAVDSLEALVRWDHPKLGLVPAATFVPIAEANDLISEIGAWVLSETCAHLGRWRRSLPGCENLMASVNISAGEISNVELVPHIESSLANAGLPGSAVHLEITQSQLMADAHATTAVLAKLQAVGVKLSIDNFGTGQSALANLRRFPVDRVKIDQRFIERLEEEGPDQTLIPGFIALASALNIKSVAGGVEDAAQADTLFRLGCDFAQGHFYSRPVRIDAVPELLERLALERLVQQHYCR